MRKHVGKRRVNCEAFERICARGGTSRKPVEVHDYASKVHSVIVFKPKKGDQFFGDEVGSPIALDDVVLPQGFIFLQTSDPRSPHEFGRNEVPVVNGINNDPWFYIVWNICVRIRHRRDLNFFEEVVALGGVMGFVLMSSNISAKKV